MLPNRCLRAIISVTYRQFGAFFRWDGTLVERLLWHNKGHNASSIGRIKRLAMDKRLRKALEGLSDPDMERRRRAMEPFVRATFETFIRYLYRYLGNEVECEDVLEDVYADIWEDPEKLRNITSERLLLRTVYLYYMRGRLREVYRRLNRNLGLSQSDLMNLTAPDLGILEMMSQQELKDALARILGHLKARERRAIQLWMDGMSNRAIANELKTTVGAVKMLKFRTLLKLRKMLRDYCHQQ